jgi:hypothetical protein
LRLAGQSQKGPGEEAAHYMGRFPHEKGLGTPFSFSDVNGSSNFIHFLKQIRPTIPETDSRG